MIGKADEKVEIDSFRGLYSRGTVDEVPKDHAQDCLNLDFTSEGHAATRDGLTKSLVIPHSGIRRFFSMAAIADNYLETLPAPAGVTDGAALLHLDNASQLWIGNKATPLFALAGMLDFAALNVNNKIYISPNNGPNGFQGALLQVLNPRTWTIRDAAGHAPEQASGSSLAAALSATTGVVPLGVHKFAVIYETDTGFWTPPGPKITKVITAATNANPVVFTAVGHGMTTGESHKFYGMNWTQANATWHVTRIDDDHFSIPLDTTGLAAFVAGNVAGGFLSATVTADGVSKIDLTAIPVGPAYVTRRLILATRADEEEFFFIPNKVGCVSEINNNTATTTTVDFDDTELIASADYLFDLLEAIPAGSGMAKYRGRIAIAAPYLPGITERVLVSNIDDIESFNWVSGYIQVQTERDSNEVHTLFVLRDTLYMAKGTGTFGTEDNGGNPSTWAVTVVDAVVGCWTYGASAFTQTQSSPDTGDIIVVASVPGVYFFDGVYRRPELSWKIEALWRRINFNFFHRVTVTHDPWRHKIYITVPLDSATEPNVLLVCDYTDGRDKENVKWGAYTFHKSPTCIGMMYFGSSISPTSYTLKVGSIDSTTPNLYSLTPAQRSDDGTAISSYYIPGPYRFGGVCFFKYLMYRAWGVGRLTTTLTGLDGSLTTTPPFHTLTATPGRELYRDINFTNEQMNVKLSSGTTLNDYMVLDRIDVWGKQQWPVRPSV